MFSVETGLAENSEAVEVAQALRRAVMSMVGEKLENARPLRAFFSGHEPDGTPAQSDHPHLAFAFDPRQRRLLVVAPHVLDRRDATYEERQELEILDQALRGFHELRAGAAGLLKLRTAPVNPDTDALFAARRTWESVTPAAVSRLSRTRVAFARSPPVAASALASKIFNCAVMSLTKSAGYWKSFSMSE